MRSAGHRAVICSGRRGRACRRAATQLQRLQGCTRRAGDRPRPAPGTERFSDMTGVVGQPVSRLDGYEKTMGHARYTGEIFPPGLAYAAVVGATIPSGTVTAIDSS